MFTDNRSLSIGIPAFDEEHQALDNLVAILERLIVSQSTDTEIQAAFKNVHTAMLSHFKHEETTFGVVFSEHEIRHRAEHVSLLRDMNALKGHLESGDEIWRNKFFTIANELTRHIIKYDMEIESK